MPFLRSDAGIASIGVMNLVNRHVRMGCYSQDAKCTTFCLMEDILGGVQQKMISAPMEKGKKVLTMSKYIEAARAATIIAEKHGIPLADLVDTFAEIPAADVIQVPNTGIGDVSDGYHTFNELYHHRAVLFSVICNLMPEKAWKSKQHDTGDMYDGMFIVGIETPEGQATYHYDIYPYWDMFNVKEVERAPKWDGHTPSDAIERIGTLSAADVAPVVHAKWDANGRCTNCGGHAPFYSMASTYHESPYCFECGAIMDKEKE